MPIYLISAAFSGAVLNRERRDLFEGDSYSGLSIKSTASFRVNTVIHHG